ncbi:MAG: hypothetical protein C5B58_13080 [Acidobacteria bacterium]|nr:MAG: hypothetical protein C5B58_13080 [Acidobacteriota bacterium]
MGRDRPPTQHSARVMPKNLQTACFGRKHSRLICSPKRPLWLTYPTQGFVVCTSGSSPIPLRAVENGAARLEDPFLQRRTIEPKELIQAIWQLPPMEPPALSSPPADENNASVGQAALSFDQGPNYLAEGHRMSGEICFEGPGRIDGEFEGEITATASVIIGESAAVTAKVKAASIVVAGTFFGEITVSGGIEIRPSARVSAKLTQELGDEVDAHGGFQFDTAQAGPGGSPPQHSSRELRRFRTKLGEGGQATKNEAGRLKR